MFLLSLPEQAQLYPITLIEMLEPPRHQDSKSETNLSILRETDWTLYYSPDTLNASLKLTDVAHFIRTLKYSNGVQPYTLACAVHYWSDWSVGAVLLDAVGDSQYRMRPALEVASIHTPFNTKMRLMAFGLALRLARARHPSADVDVSAFHIEVAIA